MMEINSSSEYSLEEEPAAEFPWLVANGVLEILAFATSILGVFGNFLCYITAMQLPASNSAFLMGYLAIWDTIGGLTDGVDVLAKHFGFFIKDINVRNFILVTLVACS